MTTQLSEQQIERLRLRLTEVEVQNAKLRDCLADCIGALADVDPRLRYVEAQIDRETLAEARLLIGDVHPAETDGTAPPIRVLTKEQTRTMKPPFPPEPGYEEQPFDLDVLAFRECAACEAKPGAPDLCPSCLHNRWLIDWLKHEQDERAAEIVRLRAHIDRENERLVRKIVSSETTTLGAMAAAAEERAAILALLRDAWRRADTDVTSAVLCDLIERIEQRGGKPT